MRWRQVFNLAVAHGKFGNLPHIRTGSNAAAAQHVTLPSPREDQARPEAHVNLLAQKADVDVDEVGAAHGVGIVGEEMAEHLSATDHLPALAGEQEQKLIFAGREGNDPPAAFDPPDLGVDFQVVDSENSGQRFKPFASHGEHRVHLCC